MNLLRLPANEDIGIHIDTFRSIALQCSRN